MQDQLCRLQEALLASDAVLIGAGAGLSASAGLTYSGERFDKHFEDFHLSYGIRDMYQGAFFPFDTPEEHWAYWSRLVLINRYETGISRVHQELLELVKEKDYFVLTTNVDHQFQHAGFDKSRLFYTQGDYGLFQCAESCHASTYDNEAVIRHMVSSQSHMRIPSCLIPCCPLCGQPMTINLRSDNRFVEDAGWHAAAGRYRDYLQAHGKSRILYLELGVGYNTPDIIKYSFWNLTGQNPSAMYASINTEPSQHPMEIARRSILINLDIGHALSALRPGVAQSPLSSGGTVINRPRNHLHHGGHPIPPF